jgi:hypothetical protein
MNITYTKLKLSLCIAVVLLLFVSCSKEHKTNSYYFSRGTPLRENHPKNTKIVFPELVISNGKNEKRLSFPLGAEIWKDKKDSGCLIVKYMDKRFAAFGSDAYAFVDMDTLEVLTVVTDVIYEIDSYSDDYLIGVQRLPEHADYTDDVGDTEYEDSGRLLFIIKFDYKNRRFQRINVLSGPELPDGNQILTEEDAKNYKRKFHVNNGVLYFEKDNTVRNYPLPEIIKRINKFKFL